MLFYELYSILWWFPSWYFWPSSDFCAFSFFVVFSLKKSVAGNICVFFRVILLGYIPLAGHFSACQMATVMLTIFCCVMLHLPCLDGSKFPGYQLLRGAGRGGGAQWQAGGGFSLLGLQRRQVVVVTSFFL